MADEETGTKNEPHLVARRLLLEGLTPDEALTRLSEMDGWLMNGAQTTELITQQARVVENTPYLSRRVLVARYDHVYRLAIANEQVKVAKSALDAIRDIQQMQE